MDKNGFWSVDKLIPGIGGSASFAFEKRNQGVLIQNLHPDESGVKFGPVIRPRNSRVIRSYQISEISDSPHNALLKMTEQNHDQVPDFVSCGLFSPSLLALNSKQREYFFYACKCLQAQKKVALSFPYLQLYICRIVRMHLHEKKLPNEFFWVWKQYRSDFPMADKLFCDSVSDFCLLTETEPPYTVLGEIFTENSYRIRSFLLERFFFDYLFREENTLSMSECNLTLRFLTGESFRKTKAYSMHPVFGTVAEDAVMTAMKRGLFNRKDLNDAIFRIQIPSEVRVERSLFPSLPKQEIPQGTISLCYVPLLNDENIRSRFDETIRYLENRIRKILKMKNSLSRIHISSEHQAFLESILLGYEHLAPSPEENEEGTTKAQNIKIEINQNRELSINFEDAAKIEEESWILTQKLTESYTEQEGDHVTIGGQTDDENFDETYREDLKSIETRKPVDGQGEFWEFAATLTEIEDEFIRIALHNGKEEARKFAMANGCFFEAMIATCNAKAQETIEDSIFDGAGNLYEDYRSSMMEVFPPVEG